MDELLVDFLTESREHIQGAETQILQFENDPHNASLVAGIFRLVHTIKGTAGFVGLERLQRVAHAAETVIGDLRDGVEPTPTTISLILSAIDRIKVILADVERLGEEPEGNDTEIISALEMAAKSHAANESATHSVQTSSPAETNPLSQPATQAARGESKPTDEGNHAASAQSGRTPAKDDGKGRSTETIRVNVDTIESIMQLVSELVLTRNQLLELTRRSESEILKGPLQRLSSLTTDLQDAVMRARMQPVGRLYTNLPRLVRELASELGKKLSLVTEGADTEIDRQLIEVIRDPLTHLIRNCADHGIEPPDVRQAAGKSETGEIRVSASHQAGQITINIADDGRGLNVDKIAAKVIASGRATADEIKNMSTDEICRFIFEPGVSTAEVVSNVSGRGVGMDVVRSNIEAIGGTVSISTRPGQGTIFALKIPLTLAIAPALILEAGGQRFALPQHAVVEVVSLGGQSPHTLERVQNALILRLREEVLPAIELSTILGVENGDRSERLAVIMKLGTTPFAIIVDDVLDVQEIVVKPLSASLAHLKVFSGRTILGDGTVVLILDSGGIAARIGIDNSNDKKREAARKLADSHERTRLILFRAGPGALKVLPLSVISRIETVKSSSVNEVDGRLVMLRQSRLMPIITLSHTFDPHSANEYSMLVIGTEENVVGIVVDNIIDIVEENLLVQIEGGGNECIGMAQIRGEPVEVVDIAHFVTQAQVGGRPADSQGSVLVASQAGVFTDYVSPILSAVGYTITTVASGQRLSELVESGADGFDVVLIDLDLPVADKAAWLDRLSGHGITEDRIVGLYADQKKLKNQRDQSVSFRCAARADRHTWIEFVSQAVDGQRRGRNRDRGRMDRELAA